MKAHARTAISIFFGILLMAGAIGHVVNPDFYAGFIPEPIPQAFANGSATIVEGAIGVLFFIPRQRKRAALAFAALMVAFMPIHIWDALKDAPAIGSHALAYVRIAIQLGLIATGAWLWRAAESTAEIAS